MTSEIFVHTAHRVARRTKLFASGLPQVTITQRTETILAFAFVDAAGAVEAITSARVVIKDAPTAAVLLLDSSLDLTGSGEDARHEAVWAADAVDSAALRAFLLSNLGTNNQAQAWCEVEWIAGGETDRVSFALQIQAAFFLPDDTAPDPASSESDEWLRARAVRFDESQTLSNSAKAVALGNLGIRITAGGYLEVTAPDGSKFNIGLNSGAAPE